MFIVGIVVIALLLLSAWLYVDLVEESKRLRGMSSGDLDFFIYKWFSIVLSVAILFALFFGKFVHDKIQMQKMYYKSIIDSSSNIVIVLDKDGIIEVNKTFFKYFYKHDTLEEFKKENKSISDFFVEKEGYVYKKMESLSWLEYIMQNPKNNQVKIIYEESIYYFSVGVSLISARDGHYSAIFSDITKEKLYQKELEHTNITDPLTKIRNRYYYNEQIKKESANANRYFYPLALVLFDIDHFKSINDNYGHDVGDNVLVEYTRLISSHLRNGDIFCRIGGEEFTLILPHTNMAGAYKIADKLRALIEAHKKIMPITMSFGVVEYTKGEDLEVMFKRADEALYEAKNLGRNRVVVK